MKAGVLSVFALVLLAGPPVYAQDAVKADPAHYKVLVDNASVRVLKISYPPGGKSVMHQHPDSVVIPLQAAQVRFGLPDGTSEDSNLGVETATFAPAHTHNPANIGKGPVEAILVEFKGAAAGKTAVPASRDNMGMKVLGESPRAVALRVTAEPDFQEAPGTTHDYDQVVIALSSGPMSLSIDGKPAKTNWTRGDVAFIGRGVKHESKNASGKPIDFIIVAVK